MTREWLNKKNGGYAMIGEENTILVVLFFSFV